MKVFLKPQVKQLWLEALRSGNYAQCPGKLADGRGGHCCLGVLSELAVQEGVVTKEVEEHTYETLDGGLGIGYSVHYGRYMASNYLPREVAEWAFEPFDETSAYWENPRVNDPRPVNHPLRNGQNTDLANLNDEGLTFHEIADVIEKEL
jgi:hypothetical protein